MTCVWVSFSSLGGAGHLLSITGTTTFALVIDDHVVVSGQRLSALSNEIFSTGGSVLKTSHPSFVGCGLLGLEIGEATSALPTALMVFSVVLLRLHQRLGILDGFLLLTVKFISSPEELFSSLVPLLLGQTIRREKFLNLLDFSGFLNGLSSLFPSLQQRRPFWCHGGKCFPYVFFALLFCSLMFQVMTYNVYFYVQVIMSQYTTIVGDGNVGGSALGGNPEKPHRKFKKGDRARRMWIPREEEILARLWLNWWLWDGNQTTVSAQVISKSVKTACQEFPTTDLKGTPHIVSKITSWKPSYNSLRSILERIGVGFNVNDDYKIDIDDEQWKHAVQLDPKAKFMHCKSWPLWETWKLIFGKDRATGSGAETVSHAAIQVRSALGGGSQCDKSDSHAPYEEAPLMDSNVHDEDHLVDSHIPDYSDKQTSVAKSGGVKRKATTSDALLIDFLANLHAETNTRLELISSRIVYEFDLGRARQAVFDQLGDVEGYPRPKGFSDVVLVACPKARSWGDINEVNAWVCSGFHVSRWIIFVKKFATDAGFEKK
ncbi:hypothetical protein SASPL_152449 [Salvia splendens]|uniref:Myb/SANT-like domain-containing protein n=1 Tax=Salvia splendens TaxID=180675 RepID=A0A8X8W326_SALSN|nr:hypothetical protein SASPL_152449 [Salvia splendens]